jgi:hypothetical protein
VTEETLFQKKLRERREATAKVLHAEAATSGAVAHAEFADLIPDADTAYARSDTDLTIDALIDGLDILSAYDRWIPKPRPKQSGNKREGIMVRCPRPDHTDNNPSAWINTDKQVWTCATCGGGDKLDLASFYFGMGDYKSGKRFGELREKIAENLGYTVIRMPGVAEPTVVASAPEPAPAPPPPLPPAPVAPPVPIEGEAEAIATVTSLFDDDEGDDIVLPTLDWRPLVKEGTFLDTYMRQCTIDDVPEEYHFWSALLAVSMAIGRDIKLYDTKPVLGNLFVCIIGRTGSGKSRASSYVSQLVSDALPWDGTDPMDRGVKKLATPGSAEHLIYQFSRPIPDPMNPKVIMGYGPIRGIVEFNELSSLLGRSGRSGSILKPTLMQFFDGDKMVTTGSKTGGTDIAQDPYASCLTSTQPKALPTLVGQQDADSGFLNRWVFASGTPKKRVAIGGAMVDLMPCHSPLKAIHEWANDPRVIQWSEDAFVEFTSFYDERIEQLIAKDDTGLFARIDLLCKKLCLLFAANEMLDAVSKEIVLKVELIFDYLLQVFGIQSENIGNTEEKQCQERILDLLDRRSTGADQSVPQHYIVKVVSKKFSRKMILDSLRLLGDLGLINAYVPPQKGPGRPALPRYRLVSDVE